MEYITLNNGTQAPLAEITKLDKGRPYYVASEEKLQGYLGFAPNFDEQD